MMTDKPKKRPGPSRRQLETWLYLMIEAAREGGPVHVGATIGDIPVQWYVDMRAAAEAKARAKLAKRLSPEEIKILNLADVVGGK